MKFTIEHRDRVAIVTSTVEKLDALHANKKNNEDFHNQHDPYIIKNNIINF